MMSYENIECSEVEPPFFLAKLNSKVIVIRYILILIIVQFAFLVNVDTAINLILGTSYINSGNIRGGKHFMLNNTL